MASFKALVNIILFFLPFAYSASNTFITFSNGYIQTYPTYTRVLESLELSWRRSPQCTSSLLDMFAGNGQPVQTDQGLHTLVVPEGKTETYSFTDPITTKQYPNNPRYMTMTGPTSTVFRDLNYYLQYQSMNDCCGACTMYVGEVEIMYWPESMTIPAPAPATGNFSRGGAPVATEPPSAVAADGFTYTYPSTYLEWRTIQAFDECSTIGTPMTNVRIGLPQNALSTELVVDPGPPAHFHQFHWQSADMYHLDCDPNGPPLTMEDGSVTPCRMFVAPLQQVLDLDPAFQNCIQLRAGYDPPVVLSPVPPMTPPSQPTPDPTPPVPASSPSNPPQETQPPSSRFSSATEVAKPKSTTTLEPPKQTHTALPELESSKTSNKPVPNQQNKPTSSGPRSNQPEPKPQSSTISGVPVTIGSLTLHHSFSNFIIGSQTIVANSAQTINSQLVSLDQTGHRIVVGSRTIALPPLVTSGGQSSGNGAKPDGSSDGNGVVVVAGDGDQRGSTGDKPAGSKPGSGIGSAVYSAWIAGGSDPSASIRPSASVNDEPSGPVNGNNSVEPFRGGAERPKLFGNWLGRLQVLMFFTITWWISH